MPDQKERKTLFDPEGDERGYEGKPKEQVPGHTPGAAEGEPRKADYGEPPFPSPDKTPGNAEG